MSHVVRRKSSQKKSRTVKVVLLLEMLNLLINTFSIGFFERARSGCEHSASFKRVNMQNKHGARYDRTIVI